MKRSTTMVLLWCLLGIAATIPARAQSERDTDPDAWDRYRVGLDLHPVGYAFQKRGWDLNTLIPMHPAGFPSERYTIFPAPMFAPGGGWEIMAGISDARTLGKSQNDVFGGRIFYGGGLQKQLTAKESALTEGAVSLGGYGYAGPNSRSGGMVYLVYSRALGTIEEEQPHALFGHLGVKTETFTNNVSSGTGVRPFVGFNAALSRVLFLSGEFSPNQPWETANQFSSGVTWLFYKRRVGITVGMQGNGYRTYPSVGIAL